MSPRPRPDPVVPAVAGASSRWTSFWIACAAGVLVFAFRLTSLRDLTNDHYMHLSWARQLLVGELPGRDFVDPGMPLAYGLSALAQALAVGPFSEAALSCIMLGLTAAATCRVVERLTGSRLAAVASALTAAALIPRLYNYPKLLVPALTLLLLQRYVDTGSPWRRTALAVGVSAAVLFRHDLGLYAAIVTAVTTLIANRHSWPTAFKELVLVGAVSALVLAPYLVYTEWSEGLVEHVRRGIEFSKGESNQLEYDWPSFPWLAGQPWSREDATALVYYTSWMLPLAALTGLTRVSGRHRTDRLPLAIGATLFLALYLPVILRYPLDQRLPDIATPLVAVGAFVATGVLRVAWRIVRSSERALTLRLVAGGGAGVALALTLAGMVNAGIVGGFSRELEATRLDRGISGVRSKLRSLREDTASWPWTKFWPNSGEFPQAVLYARACTAPDDYLLLTWPSSEYFYFAERKFASGHTMFLPPNAFTTTRDQEFVLARLRQERPPLALINKTRAAAFARAFPLVDAYITSEYVETATYKHYDDDDIAIGIRKDLEATSTFGADNWPCGLRAR